VECIRGQGREYHLCIIEWLLDRCRKRTKDPAETRSNQEKERKNRESGPAYDDALKLTPIDMHNIARK